MDVGGGKERGCKDKREKSSKGMLASDKTVVFSSLIERNESYRNA